METMDTEVEDDRHGNYFYAVRTVK